MKKIAPKTSAPICNRAIVHCRLSDVVASAIV